MRSKLAVVLCTVSVLGLPLVGDAAVGPSGLGPASGSCRLERVDDPVRRSLTQCTITAAGAKVAVAGSFLPSTMIDVGLTDRTLASFEGPGVSKSWTARFSEIIDVAAGERYTLVLYEEGAAAATSGATDADVDTATALVENLTGHRLVLLRGYYPQGTGIAMWSCEVRLQPPGNYATDLDSDGVPDRADYQYGAKLVCSDPGKNLAVDAFVNAFRYQVAGSGQVYQDQALVRECAPCYPNEDVSPTDVLRDAYGYPLPPDEGLPINWYLRSWRNFDRPSAGLYQTRGVVEIQLSADVVISEWPKHCGPAHNPYDGRVRCTADSLPAYVE